MIQLPDNYLDLAYVDNIKGTIFLHLKNSADEYFTFRYFLDKAYSFDQHMDRLKQTDFASQKAYKLHEDLTTEFIDPTVNDWLPAPLPGDNMISFLQYRGHSRLAKHEDSVAKGEDA